MSNLQIIQNPPNTLIIQQGIKGDQGIQGIQGVQGLPGNSVAGAAITKTVSLNFGTNPVTSKSFVFADADVTTVSRIFMQLEGDSDEAEMEIITISAKCNTNGFITAYFSSLCPLVGLRDFVYLIG